MFTAFHVSQTHIHTHAWSCIQFKLSDAYLFWSFGSITDAFRHAVVFFFHLKQRIRCVILTLFIANSISNVKFIGDSSSIFCLSFRLFHTIYLLAMYSAHFFVNAISRFGVLHIIHEMCLHWGWRILGWAEPTKHAEKTPCWSVFEQLFYSPTFSISTKMIPIIYRRPTQPKQPIRNAFLFIFAIVELDPMCHIAK